MFRMIRYFIVTNSASFFNTLGATSLTVTTANEICRTRSTSHHSFVLFRKTKQWHWKYIALNKTKDNFNIEKVTFFYYYHAIMTYESVIPLKFIIEIYCSFEYIYLFFIIPFAIFYLYLISLHLGSFILLHKRSNYLKTIFCHSTSLNK